MSRIREHMFALEENTPIFETNNPGKIIAYLPKGAWMGIVDKTSGWIQIISARVDGWVISSSVSSASNLAKKVTMNSRPGFGTQYFINSK